LPELGLQRAERRCGLVIASEAKQSSVKQRLDCFVASLLAMTTNPIGDNWIVERNCFGGRY